MYARAIAIVGLATLMTTGCRPKPPERTKGIYHTELKLDRAGGSLNHEARFSGIKRYRIGNNSQCEDVEFVVSDAAYAELSIRVESGVVDGDKKSYQLSQILDGRVVQYWRIELDNPLDGGPRIYDFTFRIQGMADTSDARAWRRYNEPIGGLWQWGAVSEPMHVTLTLHAEADIVDLKEVCPGSP